MIPRGTLLDPALLLDIAGRLLPIMNMKIHNDAEKMFSISNLLKNWKPDVFLRIEMEDITTSIVGPVRWIFHGLDSFACLENFGRYSLNVGYMGSIM